MHEWYREIVNFSPQHSFWKLLHQLAFSADRNSRLIIRRWPWAKVSRRWKAYRDLQYSHIRLTFFSNDYRRASTSTRRVAKRGLSTAFLVAPLCSPANTLWSHMVHLKITLCTYLCLQKKKKKNTNSQIYGHERWEMLNILTPNKSRIIIHTMHTLFKKVSYAND